MTTINGTAASETLKGTSGNDRIVTGDGNDRVEAGDGDDEVNGFLTNVATGQYSRYSAKGPKTISGGIGADFLIGGSDNDTIYGEEGQDTLYGHEGNDLLDGGAGNDKLNAQSSGQDTLIGGEGKDDLQAYTGTGNKLLDGGAGDDTLYGGNGDDILLGGDGADNLNGSDGNDRLDAGDGNDTLNGGAGLDTLTGGEGDDTFFSRTTDMAVNFDDGANFMDGGEGNDALLGGLGNDTLTGGGGNDRLDGNEGNDSLGGGDGNDTLNGGAGLDTLTGGAGDDTFFSRTTDMAVNFDDGANFIDGGEGNDALFGGLGNDTLTGGGGNDRLDGNEGNDSLGGGDGNDTLYGDSGNDTLIGGEGDNWLYGSAGDDFYEVNTSTTAISDSGGVDSAIVGADFSKVPSTVEKVNYQSGVMPLPYWIDALLPDEASGLAFRQLLGTSQVYRYAFPASLPAYDTSSAHALGYAAFSSTQISRTREALSYVASVVDLSFIETQDAAQPNTLTFANNRQTGSAGYANYPSVSLVGGDLFLNIDTPSNALLSEGSYGALTLIHELGHTLGLKHPFSATDADGDVADPPYLSGQEDSTVWTVMSYTDFPAQYALRFRDLDIAALQYLYGPSKTQRTGDDTYRVGASEPNFIWDGAGTDTVSVADAPQGATVYLTPGYWSFIGPKRADFITAPGQITVNFGSVIENLQGSAFGDTLFGNEVNNLVSGGASHDSLSGLLGDDTLRGDAGDDRMTGGPGNDLLVGGDGNDTADYVGPLRDYALAWSEAGGTLQVSSGAEGTDVLSGVETLVFADGQFAANLFQSGPESPPVSLAFSPQDGAKSVPISSNLLITFNKPIQIWSGQITLKTNTGQVVETFTAANATVSGSTLTLDPKADLSVFTNYVLELGSGAIKDLSGNGNMADNRYDFKTTTVDGLYHFCVVAFGVAPGATYMADLAEAWNYGLSLRQIVDIFTDKKFFLDLYPADLSHRELATRLVQNIVKASAPEVTKAEGISDIQAALDYGLSRGEVIYNVFGNLATRPLTDPVWAAKWGGTAKQFQNQLVVARYLTETMEVKNTNISWLRSVIADVTQDTDVSTTDKIVQIIGTVPPGG